MLFCIEIEVRHCLNLVNLIGDLLPNFYQNQNDLSRCSSYFQGLLLSLILFLMVATLQPLRVQADEGLSDASFNYDFSPFIAWLEEASGEKSIPGVALAIVSREGIIHLQSWGGQECRRKRLY